MIFFEKLIFWLFRTQRYSLAHSNGKGDRLDKILKHERLIVYNLLKLIFFLD